MSYWKDMPGFFDFQDIYDEAVDTAPIGACLVEVGTLFGKSALYMAQAIKDRRPDLRFFVVDKWEMWPDVIWGESTAYSAEVRKYGSLYRAFLHHLASSGLSQYVTVIRRDSVKAAELFSLLRPYFVFIDADHSLEGCTRDVWAWQKVLGKPGIIAGHDWAHWPSVQVAVEAIYGPEGVVVRGDSWFRRES